MMGQEKNKESFGLSAYYDGFEGDKVWLTSTYVHFHCVRQLI